MITRSAILLATTLLIPATGLGDTLELPAEARVEFQLIDPLTLSEAAPNRDDVVMRPVVNGAGSHQLPAHCVVIGNARLADARVRLTAKTLTCIETEDGDSEIYSDAVTAAAFGEDGNYAIPCTPGRCTLATDDRFLLDDGRAHRYLTFGSSQA